MRIKYRAWHKTNQTMCGVSQLVFTTKEKLWRVSLHGFGDWLLPLSKVILLQSTGLTDKNGRLVYEGDIVKRKDNRVGVVRWDIRYAMFVFSRKPQALDNLYGTEEAIISQDGEIIGNCYQHPELLEGKV